MLKFAVLALVTAASFANAAVIEPRKKLPAVITSCTKPNSAALTFDDGPYEYNLKVVTKLNVHGAKGTFFVNGQNWECIYTAANVKRLRHIADGGHQIASHTWSHAHLPLLKKAQIVDEFQRVEEALQKIVGVVPAFTRPPYGEYNELVQQVAQNRSMNLVTWDHDSGDSVGATMKEQKASYKALAKAKPKSVLTLMHEVYESTVEDLLTYAITTLQDAGYELVTVAECLGLEPYQSVTKHSSRDDTWNCDRPPILN